MSSIVEFKNLTFSGDQVTFDIHVNLPSGATSMGLDLYGTFPGMSPSYFTLHTIDGTSFTDSSNTGQISLVTSGANYLTSSGTIATFSGPASVFNSIGSSGGFDTETWDIGDLFKVGSNTYGIGSADGVDGQLLTMPLYTPLTHDDITEGGHVDGGTGGGTGGGAKPAMTFEQFDVDGNGDVSFKVVLNEIPAGFDSIRFQGYFDKTDGKDITFTPDASQASLGLVGVWPGGSETTYQINGGGALSALLTGTGPFVLGTISAPASVFGTITDGTGAGTSSTDWDLQDLIHPGGELGKGFMGIEFTGIDQMLPIQDVLNYVEGGDNTGGGTGPIRADHNLHAYRKRRWYKWD